jgi:hypothetical protein
LHDDGIPSIQGKSTATIPNNIPALTNLPVNFHTYVITSWLWLHLPLIRIQPQKDRQDAAWDCNQPSHMSLSDAGSIRLVTFLGATHRAWRTLILPACLHLLPGTMQPSAVTSLRCLMSASVTRHRPITGVHVQSPQQRPCDDHAAASSQWSRCTPTVPCA